MIFVRCHSHRARHHLLAVLDREPQAYWTMQRLNHRGVYRVDVGELKIARTIPGITRIRGPEQYAFMQCWSPYRAASAMAAVEVPAESKEHSAPVRKCRRPGMVANCVSRGRRR